MNILLKDFSYLDLINKCKNDYVAFLTIGKMKGQSYYDYRVANNCELAQRIKCSVQENNKIPVILLALHNIVLKLPKNSTLHIVVSKPIGLDKYAKSRKTKELKAYNAFVDLCNLKSATVEDIIVENGENAIRAIINPKKNKKSKQSQFAQQQQWQRKQDTYTKYKPIKIDANKFNYTQFINDICGATILFIAGSCDNELNIGAYFCRIYKGINDFEKLQKVDLKSKSPNDAMLNGILDYCKERADKNSTLYVIVPTELGFNHPKKSVNKDLLFKIFQVCEQRRIDLHVIHVNRGGEELRRVVFD